MLVSLFSALSFSTHRQNMTGLSLLDLITEMQNTEMLQITFFNAIYYLLFKEKKKKINIQSIFFSISRLKRADHHLLWDHQLHCRKDHPSSLPKVLASVPSWDWAGIAHIHALLHRWPTLAPVTALEMLDSKYVT